MFYYIKVLILCLCILPLITQKAFTQEFTEKQIEEVFKKNNDIKDIDNVDKAISGFSKEIEGAVEDTISIMIKMMAPTMLAIEENKKLPKASSEMADRLKLAMGSEAGETSYVVDEVLNTLEFDGVVTKDNTTIKYRLTRNLALAILNDNIINKRDILSDELQNIDKEVKDSKTTLNNLNDEKFDIKIIKVNNIDGHAFAGYSSASRKEVFLVTNIGAYLSLHLQVNGDNYSREAKNFIHSLNYLTLSEAVYDDKRNLDDIRKKIEEDSKDLAKIDELFENQVKGNQ